MGLLLGINYFLVREEFEDLTSNLPRLRFFYSPWVCLHKKGIIRLFRRDLNERVGFAQIKILIG